MKKSILVIFVSFLIIASCSKSSSDGGSTGGGGGSTACAGVTNNKFNADVKPIIQSTCATDATCHGAGSTNGVGPLLTYDQIKDARVAIKTAVANGTMPKTGSLTTAQKNSIICWIDAGAQPN